MNLISIGDNEGKIIEMPEPKTYSVPLEDMISESVYSESGELIRNRIRSDIRKLNLGWVVDGTDAKKLLNAIKPDLVFVTYYDPLECSYITSKMHVSDRSCNLVLYKSDSELETNMWEISFSLTEY